MLLASLVTAQMRYTKLVLEPKQKFAFSAQSDILVADTLILKDSAVLQLNNLRPENYIRSRFIHIEGMAIIQGNGMHGQPGRDGRAGLSGTGPCQNGRNGTAGQNGLAGAKGTDLILYCDNLVIDKQLVINLSGGAGGRGGNGGRGGDGSTGTVHCSPGQGGDGGAGGNGGNGGHGGNFTFQGARATTLSRWVGNKILIYTNGGQPGRGGQGGAAGLGGPGTGRSFGRNGLNGPDGLTGIGGKPGTVNFKIQ